MTFRIHFQDPASEAATALELLLEASATADRGGAAFAFASDRGVQLLLSDAAFEKFLERGEFYLVVGVDSITAPSTLELLGEAEERFRGLTVRAFAHGRPGTLFHPKLCWFRGAGGGQVFVGSGNLTLGGLLENWEAFCATRMDGAELDRVLEDWSGWIESNRANLFPVDEDSVLERARQNEAERRGRGAGHLPRVDDEGRGELGGSPVLLAEIPRGKDRWNQANFDLETFRTFFQLEPGTQRRVVLLPVAANGEIGEPEVRPSVSVRSKNYRIELGQGAGLPYPDGGRPLGVFVRLGSRRFRYRLILPGQTGYTELDSFLAGRWSGRAGRMRRVVVDVDELRSALPEVVV